MHLQTPSWRYLPLCPGVDVLKHTTLQTNTVVAGLILGLRPANERRRYKVTPSLIGWAQT